MVITNDVIFITQIASILGFIGAAFWLYKLLVEQKEATIVTLQRQLDLVKEQLADAKAKSPDVLLKAMQDRAGIFEGELKRMLEDKSATQEEISAKNKLIEEANKDIAAFDTFIRYANSFIEEFVCPHCSSKLVTLMQDQELVEHDGREIEVEHEIETFACGRWVVDGVPRKECPKTFAAEKRQRSMILEKTL